MAQATYRTTFEQYESYLAKGIIAFQECETCGQRQLYPRTLCRACSSRDLHWLESKGAGTLHSFSILHRSPDPDRELPYVVALVDLDEGVRAMATMDDPADQRLACDARVQLQKTIARSGEYVAVFTVADH